MTRNKGKPSAPSKPPARWQEETKGQKPNRSVATELERRRAGKTKPEHRAGGPDRTGGGAREDRNP